MNHKVTALKLQKKNRQRVNVYLDGEFGFGLARIVAAWLEVGQEISDEKIEQLQAQDAREVAYLQALNYLNHRPRSQAEIRKNLQKKKIAEEIISEVLERLKRSGLVNDARFAEAWVENRKEFRPRSSRALAYELRRRGVEQQVIQQALEDFDDDEVAYQAARKHFRKLRDLEWPEFRQKMYAFLARRGFNYGASAEATQRVWDEKRGDLAEDPESSDFFYKEPPDNKEVNS